MLLKTRIQNLCLFLGPLFYGRLILGRLILYRLFLGRLTLGRLFLGSLCLLMGLNFYIPNAKAALPAEIEGEPLPSLAPMLERVNPAVVNISTTSIARLEGYRDPFFRLFEPPRQQSRPASLGSGVIIDAQKGLILTNHHVIENADAIKVSLVDGKELDAKLLGSDKDTDVAVIQVQSKGLTDIAVGDSDALRVGDFVVAIGNPFSLGNSVTSGIVSAKGRQGLGIEQYEDFIQTDAAINPGNSGGALVNLRGELVGINTAILGPAGGNVGIGFAIPVKLALNVMNQLIDYGEVRRGLLGVVGSDLTPRIASALGLTDQKGVVVTRVIENSAAKKAGVLPYDIITHLNGQKIASYKSLLNQIGLLPTNAQVELTIIRDDKNLTIKTQLEAPRYSQFDGKEIHPALVGLVLGEPLNLDESQSAIKVMSIQTSSLAYQLGLRKGDKIIGVGRYRVYNQQQFASLASNYRRGLPLVLERDEQRFALMIQ